MTDRLTAALEGRYAVERELGEGGMATVYLAEDLKHKRRVAIKVLKPELAAVVGAERFLAEIETTANLQHPHVLPLFDSGEADSFLYYVMPYVEGESLRERLEREKQLPVEEAVDITTKIAGALDYAHRQGVVHRDVKPANILLQDGNPVVADFGIALALSAAGGGRLTETGLSLGTPHYMSPEQATADREIGAHSDQYALACVTYEMLAGSPPFAAPTAQAVLVQILTGEAKPVRELRRSVPEHVAAAVEKAMEKLPADRFPTVEAFGRALRDPAATEARRRTGVGGGIGERRGRWREVIWPAVAALMTVAAVAGWATRDAPAGPVSRLVVSTPNESGESHPPGHLTLSHDGRSLAYQAEGVDGSLGLYVRDLASEEARRVVPHQLIAGDFSPDGDRIAFHNGAELKVIGLRGGAPSVLATGIHPFGDVVWSGEDWIYFTDEGGELMRIRGEGGAPEAVRTGDAFETLSALDAVPSLDGLVVWDPTDNAIGLLDLATGAFEHLTRASRGWLLDDRYLVWYLDGEILGQRFDPAARTLVGSPSVLVEGVGTASGVPLVDVSASGTIVYGPTDPVAADDDNLVAVARSGARVERNRTALTDLGISLSPAGDRIVHEERTADGSDIYVTELATGTRTRLTFDASAYYPTWSPDGERVAYYRQSDEGYGLYWRSADGSGVEEVLLDGPGREIEVRFLPDGERILVRQGDQSRGDAADIFLYRIGDPDSATPIAAGPGREVAPMPSPDGRFVAYVSDELGGTPHVFVRSVEDPRERWQISAGPGGTEPLWNPDGKEIFYRAVGRLMAVPVSLDPTFRRRGEPVELFATRGLISNPNHVTYALMPDGETFLFIQTDQGLETRIVLNWIEEVRERLGPG